MANAFKNHIHCTVADLTSSVSRRNADERNEKCFQNHRKSQVVERKKPQVGISKQSHSTLQERNTQSAWKALYRKGNRAYSIFFNRRQDGVNNLLGLFSQRQHLKLARLSMQFEPKSECVSITWKGDRQQTRCNKAYATCDCRWRRFTRWTAQSASRCDGHFTGAIRLTLPCISETLRNEI